jgi:hypothetical protein
MEVLMALILGLGLYAFGWFLGYMTAMLLIRKELVKVKQRIKVSDLYPEKKD